MRRSESSKWNRTTRARPRDKTAALSSSEERSSPITDAAASLGMLSGRTLLHYNVLAPIGAGGMGQVYRAIDTRLGRAVALKFLRFDTLEDDAKIRFRNEARVTATLDHPNICAIHALEEFEEVVFLVMPCLVGRTLKERIAEGAMPLEEVLETSARVGTGLAAAHAKGVIHRDIKPSNIMLTDDGRVLVLDFGLARLGNATDPAERGIVAGTAVYMSPEQARGDPVDSRTDIWSLGIVMYEMVAGVVPFQGGRWDAVLGSIIRETVPPMKLHRPDVPPALEKIVLKSLSKDPTDRYSSVSELLEAIRVLRSDAAGIVARPTNTPSPHNLPRRLTSFVGRDREIREVREGLGACRLMTLTGAGGSGKTSLALQVCATVLPERSEGVWFVELASLFDPTMIPQVVAAAMGVRLQHGVPVAENLNSAIGDGCQLIVLDNCEHLVEGCARFAEGILGACSNLRILATSREPLDIPGETLYPVPPLTLPPSGHEENYVGDTQDLLEYESVRLFVERARAVSPRFWIANDNAAAVVRICRRLDGIPLALELAAVRVMAMSVEQIASRLDDRFQLLTAGRRTAVPRHQTLLATVEWSFGLLSERERILFRRLAVFAGGWTLEGAETVGTGDQIAAEDIVGLLVGLVSKSLVVLDAREEPRYHYLETLREYAGNQLGISGEQEAIGRRHLDYFLNLTEASEEHLCGPEQVRWMNRLRDEQDNLRVAMERALKFDTAAGMRIGASAAEFWFHRDLFGEGRAQLLSVLSHPAAQAPTLERAKALNSAAWLLSWALGEYDESRRLADEALAIGTQHGSPLAIGRALLALGIAALGSGDPVSARALLDRARENLESVDAKGHLGDVFHHLGNVDLRENDDLRAKIDFEMALHYYESVGHINKIAGMSRHRANVALRLGDLQTATILTRRSIELNIELKSETGVISCLVTFGRIITAHGRYRQAAIILGAVDGLLIKYRTHLYYADGVEYQALQQNLQEQLGGNQLEIFRHEGQTMHRDEAVSMALEAITGL